MIGDALGLPVAGLKKGEIERKFGKLSGYTRNESHPFFFHLKEGQFGSNTRLMLLIIDLLRNKTYSYSNARRALFLFARKCKDDFLFSRWLGETITTAALMKKPIHSESMTCVYHSLPLILIPQSEQVLAAAIDKQSQITHCSDISRAASLFMGIMLSRLIYGKEQRPDKAAEYALLAIKSKFASIDRLVNPIEKVLFGPDMSVQTARRIFGTGSLAYQTIPLALFFSLRKRETFEKTVLLGANSFRDDNPSERKRLATCSYIRELLDSRGGATDGVAGVIGAIIGASEGISQIPTKLKMGLEDYSNVSSIVRKIVMTSSSCEQ